MTEKVSFTIREIGSLAKPGWLVKAMNDLPLVGSDVEYAQKWGGKLGVEDYDELVDVLQRGGGFTTPEKTRLQDYAALYGIRLLERAGLGQTRPRMVGSVAFLVKAARKGPRHPDGSRFEAC